MPSCGYLVPLCQSYVGGIVKLAHCVLPSLFFVCFSKIREFITGYVYPLSGMFHFPCRR